MAAHVDMIFFIEQMHKPVLNIKGKIPNIVFMSRCDAKTALSRWDMERSSLAVSRAVWCWQRILWVRALGWDFPVLDCPWHNKHMLDWI